MRLTWHRCGGSAGSGSGSDGDGDAAARSGAPAAGSPLPRPLAVLLTYVGAKERHVATYVKLLHRCGSGRGGGQGLAQKVICVADLVRCQPLLLLIRLHHAPASPAFMQRARTNTMHPQLWLGRAGGRAAHARAVGAALGRVERARTAARAVRRVEHARRAAPGVFRLQRRDQGMWAVCALCGSSVLGWWCCGRCVAS